MIRVSPLQRGSWWLIYRGTRAGKRIASVKIRNHRLKEYPIRQTVTSPPRKVYSSGFMQTGSMNHIYQARMLRTKGPTSFAGQGHPVASMEGKAFMEPSRRNDFMKASLTPDLKERSRSWKRKGQTQGLA